jgi:hypothetical protein
MSDEHGLLQRTPDPSAANEFSHGAERDARTNPAPLNAMGANVTIQKNWRRCKAPP